MPWKIHQTVASGFGYSLWKERETRRTKVHSTDCGRMKKGQYINFGSTTVAKKSTSLSLKNDSSLSLINI